MFGSRPSILFLYFRLQSDWGVVKSTSLTMMGFSNKFCLLRRDFGSVCQLVYLTLLTFPFYFHSLFWNLSALAASLFCIFLTGESATTMLLGRTRKPTMKLRPLDLASAIASFLILSPSSHCCSGRGVLSKTHVEDQRSTINQQLSLCHMWDRRNKFRVLFWKIKTTQRFWTRNLHNFTK